MSSSELIREYPRGRQARGGNRPQTILQELVAQKLVRAVYSERQLQEVMTDFWFNHFNVFWGKGPNRWLTTDFEMNAIRPHALGKFKDLLMATAKSPAMLFYLDNFQSVSPDPRSRRPQTACEAKTRHQRKLREGDHGAAHPGCRRRIHATGRPGSRARIHRMVHRPTRLENSSSGR